MKKNYALLSAMLLFALSIQAQVSFTDDFEGFNVGQTIAVNSPVWATWSGNVAGEDAPVSIDQAHSGTKSAKFFTTATGGGPSDVILPFGGAHDLGDFSLTMWMYVVTGRGAYFNFQSETAPGVKWSADFFFDKAGTLDVAVDGASIPVIIDGVYPVGAWFELKVLADLSGNKWQILVNGNVVGSFFNPANKIASMDLFAYGPSGSLGHYYVDDVVLSYIPLVPVPNDGVLYTIDSRKLGLTGDEIPVQATVRNIGLNPITSFDAVVDNGNSSQTYSITQTIAPLGLYTFALPTPYTLMDGEQDMTITLANLNGGVDDNPDNNAGTAVLRGYTPAPGKRVVVEEATGTWCQWCVRGIVFMELMRERYPNHFVGIGVHNNDPMMVVEYDAGLTNVPDFSGFPSVVVQRETLLDPNAMELPFLEAVTVPTPAVLENGAQFDVNTGVLDVSVTAHFTQSVNDLYRLNAVIVEDAVNGTGAGWNQSNAYAGGAAGPMGGFESLPASIPASQMVYNDVARAILGGFGGLDNSVPSSVAAGTAVTANFSFTLTNDNDYNNLHIAGILIGPNGEIVNADYGTVADAVANGFTTSVKDVLAGNKVEISPNPASGTTNIGLSLAKPAETSVRVFNTVGQEVASRNYGVLAGDQLLPFVTSGFANGVYTVQVIAGGQTISGKLVVRN